MGVKVKVDTKKINPTFVLFISVTETQNICIFINLKRINVIHIKII